MTRMNWDRRGGGDDDYGAVGTEPTIRAKYRGVCATCGTTYEPGDDIASTRSRSTDNSLWHHGHCRYPTTLILEDAGRDGDVYAIVDAAGSRRAVELCPAKTKKGQPCTSRPKAGERYCGPHLDQLARQAAAPPTGKPDPYDEPF